MVESLQKTDEKNQWWLQVAGLVIMALAGTLLLYREALALPFFFDDMIHLRWLDWHSLPEVWSTAEGLGYYRPLTTSVWKVGHLLLGHNDPQRLHLLNLLLHGLNTVLAGTVAWRAYRGPGRYAFCLATASLFMVFPFSYQAVPSTSSLSKPLIATLALGSALLYWQARRRESWLLLGLSLLAGFLAPFVYETGVMVPLAILAVEALGVLRKEFKRVSWKPLLYMALVWGVALPIIVLMEPDTGASLRMPTLMSLWRSAIFFGQGLAFPLAPLATPLSDVLPVDEFLIVAAVNLLSLVGLWALYRWAKQNLLFWYAVSWLVVGVLPQWLMLDFAYVITSPRLLYLGGAGCAMLWAGAVVLLWVRQPSRWWMRALAVVLMVGILGFSVAYVRDKMVMVGAVAEPIWDVVEAAKLAEAGEADGHQASILVLNVPSWAAPKEPTYRIGTEGLTLIPEYVRVQDSVFVNSGIEPEVRAFMYDPVKEEWVDHIGYAGDSLGPDEVAAEIRQVDAVYLMAYGPESLHLVEAGGLEPAGELELGRAGVARFGNAIRLEDYAIRLECSLLIVDLWWAVDAVPGENATVFLHAYDREGKLVAQKDGYPIAGIFPPWYWQMGDVIHDLRIVPLPEALDSGRYSVAVGWYNAESGQRLPAVHSGDMPIMDGALELYAFTVPASERQ